MMKKVLFTVVVSICSIAAIAQSDRISINDVNMYAGESCQMKITMKNVSAAYTAFQFDLDLPEGIHIATDKSDQFVASLNDERAVDHMLYVGKIAENTYRFLSYSMNNTDFLGSDGTLLSVTLEADSETELEAKTASFHLGFLVSATNEYNMAEDFSFNINIQSPASKKECVKISSAKQLPYCSDKDLDFKSVTALKAYVATGYDKATGTIWLTRVKDVPANTGFLIMGDAGDYDVPVKDGGSNSYYTNMFKGTLEKITLQTTETIGGKEYTNYYLSNGEQGVGFYKVTKAEGQSLGANRAYLPIPTDIPVVGTAGGTEAIKVSGAGQVPYYSANSLDFTDMPDVKAYTATGYDYKSGTIWLTRVKKVPALTGILIMADAGNYDVPKTSVASIYENMFKGTLEAMTLYTTLTTEDGKEYTNYYLSNGEQGVGFYKVTKAEGQPLGENRSYLSIPKQTTTGTRGMDNDPTHFGFQESDEVIGFRVFGSAEGTTGIDTNNRETITNNHWYNLQGQRVENPSKGLYIKNGQKVVIK